jgi:Putative prokaryotic signal transducing protein
MDVTREQLVAKFREYNDAELLRVYRSGELTELATDVAGAELASRGIDITPPAPATPPPPEPAPVDEPEPVPAIAGDLVMVARMFDATEAEMLRGRLEAEGVPAMVADANSLRVIQTAIGGVRLMVPEAFVDKAREILKADARGDYAIDDQTDVGPSSDPS